MTNSTVVVVTGVSSGIGRAAAERFAKRGCRVFGTVRGIAKAARLPALGLVEMDVRDDASVQLGIQSIIAKTGRIDVLVNNAGVNLIGAVERPRSPKVRLSSTSTCLVSCARSGLYSRTCVLSMAAGSST